LTVASWPCYASIRKKIGGNPKRYLHDGFRDFNNR
jgi:hypothetical protein